MPASRRHLGAWLVCLALCGCGLFGHRGGNAGADVSASLAVRGTIVKADGGTIDDGIVLVEGTRIVRVGSARDVPVPARAQVVGGRGYWVVAGLIDAHVHFFQSGGLYTRPDIVDLTARVPYEKEIAAVKDPARLADVFRRYLRSGVTSVVDAGGPTWNFQVRAIAAETALAPRVAVAGPLLSSVSRPQLALDDPPIVQVNDPDAARAMVRGQAERKPDLVKLWWVVPKGGTAASWAPVGRAAIEEAHRLGLRVAVHATELETARLAVKSGADVLVHSVEDADVDDAFVQLLLDRKTVYTTTLVVFEGYWEAFQRKVRLSPMEVLFADPRVVATLLDPIPPDAPVLRRMGDRPAVAPAALRNAKRLWEAGVVVAAGTDAGNIGTFHGPALHRELELLVQAGLTPAQALVAATANAARVMGRNDLGAVEAGKLADLVVLDADPTADVRNAGHITLVVKDGRAWQPDEILAPSGARYEVRDGILQSVALP